MRKWSGLRYLTTIFGYAGAIVHESHHLMLPKEQPKQSQKAETCQQYLPTECQHKFYAYKRWQSESRHPKDIVKSKLDCSCDDGGGAAVPEQGGMRPASVR